MKKLSITLIALLASSSLFAGVSKITCKVSNEEGQVIAKTRPFIANSRSPHPLKLNNDDVLYLRWKYHTSPVSVVVTENPHYPWNLPFGTKVLDRAEVKVNDLNGLSLSVLNQGLTLTCVKIK